MSTSKNIIRQQNLTTLKRYLYLEKSALKADMAKNTGLSVVTINSLVQELVNDSTIKTGHSIQQPVGRPALIYNFNYDKSYYLLLSIQETMTNGRRRLIIVGKAVNLAQEEVYEKTFEFSKLTIDFFISKILHFLNLGLPFSKIGISIPGKINEKIIVSSWENVLNSWNLEKEIATITNIPCMIQNDVHLMTVGYTISHNLNKLETFVGIFYPQNSMPGITIYSNGAIFEGGKNLAGEAKFLPNLIHLNPPLNEQDMVGKLTEIIEIYNAVISPDAFILSADSLKTSTIYESIANSQILSKQINHPTIYFVEEFQSSLTLGLFWLVTKDTPYYF